MDYTRKTMSGVDYLKKLYIVEMPEIILTKIEYTYMKHKLEIRNKPVSQAILLEQSIKYEINDFFDSLIDIYGEKYGNSPSWIKKYIQIRKFYN